MAGVLFSDIDDDAKAIVEKARRGAKYEFSISVRGFNEEYVDRGNTVEVNGREFPGPVIVLRSGKVREVSIVPLGADHKTNVAIGFNRSDKREAKTEMSDVEKLKQELAAAREQIDKLKADIEARDKAVAEFKRAARETEVKALFSEIGREFSAEAAAPFMELSSESFSAMADQLKEMAKAQKPATDQGERIFSAPASQQPGAAGEGESPLIADMKARYQ